MRRYIDSVWAYVCDIIELIVVDDGSSDGSVTLLSYLALKNGTYSYH